MDRVVRVIDADTGPEIAAGFVERLTQDPCSTLDVGTEIIAQRGIGGLWCCLPVPGNPRYPDRVDLQRADIDGIVGIGTDCAELASFDPEQDEDQRLR